MLRSDRGDEAEACPAASFVDAMSTGAASKVLAVPVPAAAGDVTVESLRLNLWNIVGSPGVWAVLGGSPLIGVPRHIE